MKKQTRKIKHRKPGAGAKPIYGIKMVRVAIRVTPSQLDHLNKKFGGPSAGIRCLIAGDMEHANVD